MRIAFLGGGNMAGALVGGLISRKFDPAAISVIEKLDAQRDGLAKRFAIHVSREADDRTEAADTLVLAVKPQDLRAALAPLARLAAGKLVVSVCAGVRLADISRWLGGHANLVRCMPNMPALIGEGITGLYASAADVSAADREKAQSVLQAVGEVVWVSDERLLDPVTAVSGSGPAYVFWFIEQLAESGCALGLPEAVSRKLALHTVLGAARLAAQSSSPPEALRQQVTSKGGTTEAALRVFDEEKLAERFRRAIEAASRRGAELGDLLGRD